MDAEPRPAAESNTSEFTRLLEYLKASRGFDFGAYKVSTLMRRVQKRMREVGVQSYAQYADYLEVQPNEFGPLFDTVLINVTASVELRHRVFSRTSTNNLRDRLLTLAPAPGQGQLRGRCPLPAPARGGPRRQPGGADRGGPPRHPGSGQREGAPDVQARAQRPRR